MGAGCEPLHRTIRLGDKVPVTSVNCTCPVLITVDLVGPFVDIIESHVDSAPPPHGPPDHRRVSRGSGPPPPLNILDTSLDQYYSVAILPCSPSP